MLLAGPRPETGVLRSVFTLQATLDHDVDTTPDEGHGPCAPNQVVSDLIYYCHEMEGCNLDQRFIKSVCTLQAVEMPTVYAAANENMAQLDDFLAITDWI